MNHRDHDFDLIMALAEGSLSAPDAAAAQRHIDDCPECLEELGLQRSALAAFAAAPPATLTELEAARLKRDLDTALGHERTAAATAPEPRRRFNWVPVFSVAAVLLALVLVAPALDLVGGGGDDAADAVALDAAEAQGDAGGAEAPREGLTLESQSDGGGDLATDDVAAAESAPAPPSTTAAASDEALPFSAGAEVLLDELDGRLSENDSPEDARLKASVFGVTPPGPADLDRCLPEGVAQFDVTGADSYTLGDVDLDVGPVWVTAHPMRSELGLAAHLDGTCEVIATTEP